VSSTEFQPLIVLPQCWIYNGADNSSFNVRVGNLYSELIQKSDRRDLAN
jgi:hypothetical protein